MKSVLYLVCLLSGLSAAQAQKLLPSKYFVIQNVATETTRVYERCDTVPDCPHRLIFEAKMVVGRNEEGTKADSYAFVTHLGHAKIKSWIKFYQDKAAHYPHWYKKGQSLDSLPPRAPRNEAGHPEPDMEWGKQWSRNGTIYGAFGWYAAMLTPEDSTNGISYQWMHGTMGWASDLEAPIELTRNWLLNIFANPGSSGCTRLSNGNISYLRHLLPVGSDIYRVYAHEGTRIETCVKYNFLGRCKAERILPGYEEQATPKPWEYIMLTNGAQEINGLTADAATLIARKIEVITGQNLIESGSLLIDKYPNAQAVNYTKFPHSGKSGDRYLIDDPRGQTPSNFRGIFLVEEGRFIDYQHPQVGEGRGAIRIGGLPEFRTSVPAMLTTAGEYHQPAITYGAK
jgi:hypothetical protein